MKIAVLKNKGCDVNFPCAIILSGKEVERNGKIIKGIVALNKSSGEEIGWLIANDEVRNNLGKEYVIADDIDVDNITNYTGILNDEDTVEYPSGANMPIWKGVLAYDEPDDEETEVSYLIAANTVSSDTVQSANFKAISDATKEATEDNPYDEKIFIVEENNNLYACVGEKNITKAIAVVNYPNADEYVKSKEELKGIIANPYNSAIIKRIGRRFVIKITPAVQELDSDENEITFDIAYEHAISVAKKKDVDKRVKYMRDEGVSEQIIASILIGYLPDDDVVEPKKLYVSDKKSTNSTTKNLVSNVLIDIVDGFTVLLEGPKATGKNVFWETVAWLLNKKYSVLKVNTQTTNDEALGQMSTDNTSIDLLTVESAKSYLEAMNSKSVTDEAATFLANSNKAASTCLRYQKGILAQVLTRGNCLFIIDEMDMATANFLSSIVNTLCDDHSHSFEIPGLGEVEIPKSVVFGATQNGAEYIGTQPQNEATISRMCKYILENNTSIKKILREEKVRVSDETIRILDNIYKALNEQVKEGVLSDMCINVRGFKRALHNIARGKSLEDALISNVANLCVQEEREMILNTIEIHS